MIVGLTGYKRSGKDTAAKALIQQGWTRYALADPLRHVCMAMFGWGAERMEDKDTIDPYWAISPRQAMRTVGTDLIRNRLPQIHPETSHLWVKRFRRFATNCACNIVVTDVRFPDEAQSVHELGGILIRVNRPGFGFDGDETESYIADLPVDDEIENDGSKQQLFDRLISVLHCAE